MDVKLKIGIKAVQKAGDFLLKQFHKRHTVSWKKDETVLIGEDIKSEEILLSLISKEFPQDSFLTEEKETHITHNMVWVIDPLCGSYSYLRGVETWSISVALMCNHDYILGVVYQPYHKNLYYAQKGKGAFMNQRKIHPSGNVLVRDAFISIEQAVFNSGKLEILKLIKNLKRLRVGHGSGGELSYVSAGLLDGVIKTDQSLMHFAGGRAILEEAGGVFVDFTGKTAPTYFDRAKKIDYIACSNKILMNNILQYITKPQT